VKAAPAEAGTGRAVFAAKVVVLSSVRMSVARPARTSAAREVAAQEEAASLLNARVIGEARGLPGPRTPQPRSPPA